MSEGHADHPRYNRHDPAGLEAHQAARFATAEQANIENALRQALAMLDGHPDDHLQPYAEIVRRLQVALQAESAKAVSPQG
jgi:hypothetical protein